MSRDETLHFEIAVVGELDAAWSDWLGHLTVMVEEDDPPRTVLKGALDQATLRGVLNRLWDLGLTLISVLPLQCDAEELEEGRKDEDDVSD